MALTTFISQNLGAKKYDRAKKGAAHWNPVQHFHGRSGWNYCVFCKSGSVAAFNNDPGVVEYGVREAHVITLFLLFALPFPLYCRPDARGRQGYCAYVCHACLLVCDPCDLHYCSGKNTSGDPDRVLGLSADLDLKLHSVSDLLSEIRLDPRI